MKKVSKVLLVTIFLIGIFTVTVNADSFKFNVKANQTSLKPGDTVEINMNISDIDAGDLGINTLEAILEYDSNVFEEVSQSNFSSKNNWSLTYNSEDTENKGKFLAVIVTTGVKENQDIGTLTLKVKNSAQNTNTTVTLKNVASNNGETLINETDKAITFKIESDNNANKPNTGNPGIVIEDNKNNSTQNSIKKDGDIPKTGLENYKIYIATGVTVVIAMVAYGVYKKIESKR